MLYWVRRWRLSDLNFFPSSRQTMWSAVIDFFTDIGGLRRLGRALALPARHPRQGRVHLPDQGR